MDLGAARQTVVTPVLVFFVVLLLAGADVVFVVVELEGPRTLLTSILAVCLWPSFFACLSSHLWRRRAILSVKTPLGGG